jgi:hypothetical protein
VAVDSPTLSALRTAFGDPEYVQKHSFTLLQQLCRLMSQHADDPDVQELVLRALEVRGSFGMAIPILDGAARQLGLFPYLTPEELPLASQIAYEFHRPGHFDEDIVFHRPQALVYRMLLDGKNVALSAPMSFGKSLIIDAVIASGKYSNVLIVVPTIALIDETRRRMAKRFRGRFKIITHRFQEPSARNIYVLTQERVLELEHLPHIDLFVIDEFYKLSPGRDDDDRCALLNQAFYRLAKTGSQFYMLGPSIQGLSKECCQQVQCVFLIEPYHTVVSEVHRVDGGENPIEALVSLCVGLHDPTIVFCRSPARTAEVARAFVNAGLGQASTELDRAADWVEKHYSADWHFAQALRRGIGIHHGRIPRALAQYVVRRFNDETLPFLVCTSTLIEGVNTKARNIVVFDNRINQARIDLFTFNNIRGRAGRMKQHFIGHVYVFHDPPQMGLPFVDVPVYSQPKGTVPSLLLQLDDEDLTESSRQRLRPFLEQQILSAESLRANTGIDPDSQLGLAREISNRPGHYHRLLEWSGMPTFAQVQTVCQLMWDFFAGSRLSRGSARTVAQLATMVSMLRDRPSTRDMIIGLLPFATDANEAVSRVNDFYRLWATFHFPRLLRAIDRIQREVFTRVRLHPGNYEYFASSVENLFLDPALVALDEYGVPLETARALSSQLNTSSGLDIALQSLGNLDVESLGLSEFEKELVRDAQAAL